MRENLKCLREKKGLSVKALAKKTGIHEKILADIENGKDFEVQFLIKLCCFYRMKVCEIFQK